MGDVGEQMQSVEQSNYRSLAAVLAAAARMQGGEMPDEEESSLGQPFCPPLSLGHQRLSLEEDVDT